MQSDVFERPKFSTGKLLTMANIVLISLLINTSMMMQTVMAVNESPQTESSTTVSNVLKESTEYLDKDCIPIDGLCLSSWEVANYEAIRTLHAQLDDDHNGDVDLSESVEFLREELNYTKGVERRQEAFHHNDDQHISVPELWGMWLSSEVYNWTSEQTVAWLCTNVELSQYVNVFYENAVNGSLLPRLATNSDQFLNRILGIKSAGHRSKISIKAMDVVLFGSPKDTGNSMKDWTILLLFTFLLAGSFRFYHVQKEFRHQREHMIREIDILNEDARKFREVHLFNEPSKSASPKAFDEKEESNSNENSSGEQQGEDESALFPSKSDDESADGLHWTNAENAPYPPALQLWLQLTYEKEKSVCEERYQRVLADLQNVKEKVERLKPSNNHIFAALGFVHGKTEPKYETITDDVRKSFATMRKMHEETEHRWKEIEKCAEFDIIQNSGITQLEFILEPQFQIESRASSSTAIGLSGSSFGCRQTGFGESIKSRCGNRSASPKDSGSIISSSSRHSRTSTRTTSSLHQSSTIGSGLGNRAGDIDSTGNWRTSTYSTHTTASEESHRSNMNVITELPTSTQIINDVKAQDPCSPISSPFIRTSSDATDPASPTGTAKVRNRFKPFFKSYSQDADDGSSGYKQGGKVRSVRTRNALH